ncbi:hypothetical protein ACWXWU_02215 [Shewanella sp. A14]
MSTGMMSHCDTTIFSTYKHCPDCGNKLDNIPKLSNAEKIKPNALDPIKPFYPNTTTFTGLVLDTHLYTRSKTVKSGTYKDSTTETFEEAFNFITVETENGETVKLNIDGNGQAANKVHVGDAISILEPTNLTITMPAPGGISHMLNNRLADAFIVHNQDGTRYSKKNCSENFNPIKPSIVKAFANGFMVSLLTGFIAFMCIWMGPAFPDLIDLVPILDSKDAPKIALIICAITGGIGYYVHLTRAQQHFATVEAYDQVIETLMDVTYKELGYHQHSPKKSDTDAFCNSCDTRLPQHLKHCFSCGTAQQTEPLEQSINQDSLETSDLTPEPLNNATGTSIKDKRLALMKQYQCDIPEQKFEYHKFLGTTEHFLCSAEARTYRVLDRTLYAGKNTSSSTQVSYTETRNSVGGYVGTSVNSSHTTITTKVDIDGKVLVEDHDGNIEELTVYSEILGTLDAGDYLFLAHQNIQHGHQEPTNYRMIAHNITKNIRSLPYDIRDYQQNSILEQLLPYAYFVLAIFIGYNFDVINSAQYQITHFALPTFSYSLEHWGLGLLSFFTLLFMDYPITSRMNKSNSTRAWELVKPIFEMNRKMINEDVAEKLAKYK